QSKCAAPAQLYYHQNPGAGMEQAVAARTNEAYTHLKTAFRYRKEYVQGCSCKVAEYVPPEGTLPQQGGDAGGWVASDPAAGAAQQPAQDGWQDFDQQDGGGGEALPWSTNP